MPETTAAGPALSFTWPRDKKSRQHARQRRETALTKWGLLYAHHYRSVKHHQVRKRLLKKRN